MSVYQSRLLLIGIGVLVMVSGCQKNTAYLTEKDAADPLHTAVQAVNDAIVFDIFSPPVASRVYAYPSIAAYEGFRNGYPGYKTLAGQLNGLGEIPQPDPDKEYYFPVVGLTAYLNTGKALVFSEPDIEDAKVTIMEAYKEKGVPGSVFDASGRFICTLDLTRAEDNVLEWEWRIDASTKGGIYFCNIVSEFTKQVAKVVIVPR